MLALGSFRCDSGRHVSRKQENAVAFRTFWLDVDVGPSKPYKSQDHAVSALESFCESVGLPQPLTVCAPDFIELDDDAFTRRLCAKRNKPRARAMEVDMPRVEAASSHLAARGFPLPPDELAIQIDRAYQQMQKPDRGHKSRDLYQSREKFVDARQFTITEVREMERILNHEPTSVCRSPNLGDRHSHSIDRRPATRHLSRS